MPSSSSSLRIISGDLRGRLIASPHSSHTHPMGSREKLALFNMIGEYILGAKVLDAYAGSGALGIEALSRGAAEVVFVERSPQAAGIIRENLRKLLGAQVPNPATEFQIFAESVQKFSERSEFQRYFNLILADPPYDNFSPHDLNKLTSLLAANSRLVLSFPARINPPEFPGLQLLSSRRYAAAGLAIYRVG